MKTCTRCGVAKPLGDFHRMTAAKDGRQNVCRPCNTDRLREYRQANPDVAYAQAKRHYEKNRERILHRQRARRYGLSDEELFAMLAASDGSCALCGNKIRLYVDHDHLTGVVRGLLCNKCNMELGWVEKIGLDKIIAYLR